MTLYVGLFLGNLFIFVAMWNGIFFLISNSVLSLLVYKNAKDFWILIFYPATLPNSLMSSSNFPSAPLEFSMYSVVSSAKSDSFTSF